MGWLAPSLLAGFLAITVPVVIHMINRERKETVQFPSLMFLRKIPYRSVRRQKLRHLLLLAMRCLAVAIVVAAFARPFFESKAPAAATTSDGRDVVVLLDRSYSMAHGGRWQRAQDAVRTLASQIRAVDRFSVVAFGATAQQVVEPTSSVSRVESVVSTLKPSSEPTKYAAGFRMAGQILSASELPRKEIILISDYHRYGWTANDDVSIPTKTAVRTIDVSRKENADVAVASVSVARTATGDRARATVTARATNLGAEPRTVEATLDFAGRRVDAKRVTIPARATSQIAFAGAAIPTAAARGVVRITADSQPSNDVFHFVIAEDAGASALIIEPSPRGRQNQSLFLSRALSVADDPPVRVDVKPVSAVAPADLRGRTLIVLNESELPIGTLGSQLRARVSGGGALLFIVPGERVFTAVPPEWRAVLPATIGPIVTRGDGGRWGSVDFSNALFEPFRASRAEFSSVAVSRYRSLAAADSAQVIARLDDGAPLLVERAVGVGRILLWAGTLDATWNDLPFHPLWVPFAHQLARRSMAGRESRSWFTAPHVLDLASEGDVVVESPSGVRTRMMPDSQRTSLELKERGFYEVRAGATAIGAGRPIAVNVDLAESDLSHADPAELVAGVTSRGNPSGTPGSPTFAGTSEELERRQSIWWYLLIAALILLAAETLLSNRLSRRSLDQPVTGVS
jgi:Mg-chelatase subunit ChlD